MLLMLISMVGGCMAAAHCPSEGELLAAIKVRDEEENAAIANAIKGDLANEQIVYSEPVRRIDDVHCDVSQSRDPDSVNCTFRINYRSFAVREVVELSRGNGTWRIQKWMRVQLTGRKDR